MSKKVLVLNGGFSAEREVSLNSAADIVKALQSKGYKVISHDLQDVWAFIELLKKEYLPVANPIDKPRED